MASLQSSAMSPCSAGRPLQAPPCPMSMASPQVRPFFLKAVLGRPQAHPIPIQARSSLRTLASPSRFNEPGNPPSSLGKQAPWGCTPFSLVGGRHTCRAQATPGESRWDPLLANSDVGCPVPLEQQPVNEYSDLSEALFFSWATMGPFNLSMRLAAIGLFFTVAVGWPIACASFDPQKEALQCVLSAVGGGLFPVSLATIRLYLGWQYVGNRLSSATVDYEETGWYDGQTWVKTPELLARDRLLFSYRVRPVLSKLQTALIGLGTSLAVIVALVAFLPPYAPKAELPRYNPLDDNGYNLRVIRAQEKGTTKYNPDSVEEFESPSDMEVSGEGRGDVPLDPSLARLYNQMHGAGALQTTNGVQGSHLYGFRYLSTSIDDLFEPEAPEGLYGKDEAKDLARTLRGVSDVTIVGLSEKVEGWSEGGFQEVEGTEDLEVLGGGVRSSAKKSSRISDHLSIGPDGELGIVRSLKPDPVE